MTRAHYLVLLAFFVLAKLTGCTTAQRDAAGNALVAVGTKLATDAFNTWLNEQTAP